MIIFEDKILGSTLHLMLVFVNFRELEQKLEEIKQYENSGKAGKMKSLQNELSQSDEKVQANEAKEKGLNDKMNENFQKVTSKENRERMLADNRKLQILDKEKTTNEGSKVDFKKKNYMQFIILI